MTTGTEIATTETTSLTGPAVGWDRYLEAYLLTLDSPETRRAYRRAIEAFMATTGKGSLDRLTGEDLLRFRSDLLVDGRGSSAHNLTLSAVRSFLAWTGMFQAHGLPGDLVRMALKGHKAQGEKPRTILVNGELHAMLEATGNPRDKAIVAVMAGSGLRVSEIVKLDVVDVSETEGGGMLHVRSGKGNKDRLAPCRPDVLGEVRSYLHETGRTLTCQGPLFLSHDRSSGVHRLTTVAVWKVVKRTAKAAGIEAKAVFPHSLRHTFATRYLRDNRGDMLGLAMAMGHSNIQTAMRYARHLELEELLARMPSLPL